ncbi:pectinesterase family protein, partial [uncultured Rikenella sp.]
NCSYEFVDCYIEGTTDFIFGSADAEFLNCEIRSKADSYITAASTWKGQKRGFLFRGCRLTAAEGVGACYLGRPWRIHARTCFVGCEMGAHIRPEGWHNWSKPEAERCAFYGEYGSTGPGADSSRRVKWAKKLSAREVGRL